MKRKGLRLMLGVLIISISFFVSLENVSAADKNFKDFPGMNVVSQNTGLPTNGNIIPGEYSTILRLTDETYYSFKGTTDDVGNNKNKAQATGVKEVVFKKSDMGNKPSTSNSVRLNKIAIYQGQYVDLRINIGYVNGDGSNKGSLTLKVPSYLSGKSNIKKNFLYFENASGGKGTQFFYEYEFLVSGTDQRIKDYKGMWNYKRVNSWKSVTVDLDKSKGLYVFDNSSIMYNPNITTDKLVTPYGTAGNTEDNHAHFTNLLDLPDGVFYTTMTNIKNSTSWFKYEIDSITKMEIPYPQIIGFDNNDSDSRKVSYRVVQDMPTQVKSTFYPKSYVMTINFDETVDVNSVQYTIKNVEGLLVNDKFKLLQRDPQKNTMTFYVDERTLSSTDFTDDSYRFDLTGNLKESFEQNRFKYYDERSGYYKIPANVSYVTNDNSSSKNEGNARIKAGISANPIAQRVPQFSNTNGWKDKPISELFNNMKGAYAGDDLVIESVQNKSFNTKGPDEVKVTLKGTKSGITREFTVPVTVLEQKTATLHFIDQDDKEIAPVETEQGFEGDPYDFSGRNKEISNYTYKAVDGKGSPATGTYGEAKTIDIYFKYQLNDQKVTVDYVDSKGKAIAPQFVDTLTPNQQHTFDAAVVPGYQVTSAKIDNVEITSADKSKVNVPLKDKAVKVTFTYKSVHFTSVLDANPKIVSPRGTIDYTLEIKSGMVYPQGTPAAYYEDVSITIPINSKIESVTEIKVINESGEEVGTGTYTPGTGKLTASLNQPVKDTENLRVTYKATVNNTVVAKDKIKAQASVTAKYQVNGHDEVVSSESNLVEVVVKDSDSKTINIHYVDEKGKEIKALEPESGKELQDYNFEAKTKVKIPGYTFVEVDEDKGLPIKGVLPGGAKAEDIYLVYKLAELDVKVKYVDESGAKISSDTDTSIISKETKTLDSKVVPGYKVKTVKVDDVEKPLIDNSKVEIKGSTDAIEVTFIYESIHFKLKLESNTNVVPPNGTIKYVLTATSGMKFKENDQVPNYKDVAITIPVDSQIADIADIKVMNDKDEVIGKGTFNKQGKLIDVTLTKEVKSTEAIKVTYSATASNDATPGSIIKTQASMTAKYEINGAEKAISGKSNEVLITVKSSEQKGVTIKYVDPKGNAISGVDPDTEVGSELQPYDFTEKTKRKIPGYKFKEVDETKGLPIKGIFAAGAGDVEIYIVYELDEFDISVSFQDEAGKKISKDIAKKYIAGKDYTIESVMVPGYKVKSVLVDGKEKTMTELGKIKVSVIDKAVSVVFTYESVHFSLKLDADKQTVSQGDTLSYVLEVKSGMVYPDGKTADNYNNVSISISIDDKLTDISDIKVLDSKGNSIGIGQYDVNAKQLKVTLTEAVKNTELIKVTYKAKVKDDAKTDEIVEAKATMKANYDVNGEISEISKNSNTVKITIAGGLKLVSRPETIDFGKVVYQAKDMSVDNPTINDRLVVSDTRSNSADGWQLSATLEAPLTVPSGERLNGEVIYKVGNSELELSNQSQPIYVHSGNGQSTVDVTDTWGTTAQSDGLKLKFKSTDELKTGQYSGKIRWTLMAGQP